MEKAYQFTYFISFVFSFVLIFYILLKTNIDKFFKQGQNITIRISYGLISFILATICAFGVKNIFQTFFEIINI